MPILFSLSYIGPETMDLSIVALLLLTLFASVDAFGIPSIANRPLSRRVPKLFVASLDTEATTKSILWEVIAFDNEMELQSAEDDHPMTRSELKRLRDIVQRIVLLEKRVNLGAAVLNGIRSREGAEIYKDARRKSRVEETMDKTNAFKVFGFMQQVLNPKTTGGADLHESDTNLSIESDTIFVTVLRVLNLLLLEQETASSGDLEYGTYPDHAEVS